MSQTIQIDSLHRDALIEAFNISVGKAAAALSAIVKEKISLSVPDVNFIRQSEELSQLGIAETRKVCAIKQHFANQHFSMDSYLVFAEQESLELVRIFLGEGISFDDIADLEQDALKEIGNVVLNACMSSIAGLMETRLEGSLPFLHNRQLRDVFDLQGSEEMVLMILIVDFRLEQKSINGYLIMALNLTNFNDFLRELTRHMLGESSEPC